MERRPQNLANHAKFDEPYHFFLAPVAAFALLLGVYRAWKNPSFDSACAALFGAALFVAVYRLRTYPLKVQDRLIRLEERLRLSELLPERLRPRIGEFTESQLVALRFASDAELPELAEKTLAGNLPNKQIKGLIRDWRADYFRV
jgi:hypothetical protein